LCLPPRLHNIPVFKEVQVLGDIGLGGLDPVLKFLSRTLLLAQEVDDEKTGGMGQDLEAAGCLFQKLSVIFIFHNIIIFKYIYLSIYMKKKSQKHPLPSSFAYN
jgi:hypothetical protein